MKMMINIVECSKSRHKFDGDKYRKCPWCGSYPIEEDNVSIRKCDRTLTSDDGLDGIKNLSNDLTTEFTPRSVKGFIRRDINETEDIAELLQEADYKPTEVINESINVPDDGSNVGTNVFQKLSEDEPTEALLNPRVR